MAATWAISQNYVSSTKLSAELRRTAGPIMRFRQFVRKEPALGKNTGDTVNFTRVFKLPNLATVVDEGDLLTEQEQTMDRGVLSIDEIGQAIPYTGKFETLSEHPIEPILMETLRMNMAESIDALIATQFKSGKVKCIPIGEAAVKFETDGLIAEPAATTASHNVNTYHVKECVDKLKEEYNCPAYDGSDYVAIGITKALRGIYDSPEFKLAAQYGDPSRLFDGEVGRWYGTRFVETTNSAALGTYGNGIAPNVFGGEMVIFGADPVIEAVAIEPEIRIDLPTNFGRRKKVAWYAILGWKVTWDITNPTAGKARIIHITDINA